MEDVYYMEIKDGKYGIPVPLPEPLNSSGHDGAATFSGDGQTMIYVKCGRPEGFGSCDLYICYLEGDEWSAPKNLGEPVNASSWDSQPSLSADGNLLIFSSDRSGGQGGYDLFIAKKDKNGKWGVPENLGAVVNTSGNDMSPYFAADGKTLYFSSDGHKGLGGDDLFKTTLEKGTWTTPVNLGAPINTSQNDRYFTISASGERAFFASNRAGGYGEQDIYQIEIAEELRPDATVVLTGVVMDKKTKEKLGAKILVEDLNTGELIANSESNSKTGKYVTVLPSGRDYGVTVSEDGYFFYSQNFRIEKKLEYEEIEKDILLQPIEKGTKAVLNNIFFETGKADLSPESRLDLDKVVDMMNKSPDMTMEIGGHTDHVGSETSNMKLSLDRANSVKDYLVEAGITADRLEVNGYGESNPIANNGTAKGRAANRRTEFMVLSIGDED
jgi:outer membrane protein OmpA-like peptidoglycan-associated protein